MARKSWRLRGATHSTGLPFNFQALLSLSKTNFTAQSCESSTGLSQATCGLSWMRRNNDCQVLGSSPTIHLPWTLGNLFHLSYSRQSQTIDCSRRMFQLLRVFLVRSIRRRGGIHGVHDYGNQNLGLLGSNLDKYDTIIEITSRINTVCRGEATRHNETDHIVSYVSCFTE